MRRARTIASRASVKTSKYERYMRELLEFWNIPHRPSEPWGRWILDFLLPEHRTVIEVHGPYWHDQPKYQERDARKKAALENAGFRVIHARTDQMHFWFALLESIAARGPSSTT